MLEKSKSGMNYQEILEFLPHRHPFILVDRVIDYVDGQTIHAIKAVSALEPFFPGHFPEQPIFPGVLILEGMAQAGCILIFKDLLGKEAGITKRCLLASIDKAKFRRPVIPGDVIHYHVQFIRKRGTFIWLKGTAEVDSEVIAEASFSAVFIRENP